MLFGVIGGDRRQEALLRLLREDGHDAAAGGLAGEEDWERALSAPVVVLPLPLCREGDTLNAQGPRRGVGALFRRLTRRQLILAGQVQPPQREAAEELGLRLIDYFRREELTVANAAATAEGCIQVMLEQLDRALLGSRCLVLGYGRIGRLLSVRLTGMGTRVTAAARSSEQRAWARAFGCEALDMKDLDGALGEFDVVVNTVPSMVLPRQRVQRLKGECLCVDTASSPGIDLPAAEERGLKAVWARALPGKLMPQTAAEIIRNTIYAILNEEGVLL